MQRDVQMLKAMISYVEAMEGFSEGGAEGSEAVRRKGGADRKL